MNPILSNKQTRAAFTNWITDHYEHFGGYPCEFEDSSGHEHEENDVWEAIQVICPPQ